MANAITFDIKGLAELGEKLKQLEPKLKNRIRNHSLDAAGRWMEAAVATRAPVLTGDLRSKVTRKRVGDTEIIGVRYEGKRAVGGKHSTQDPGIYAQFDEFGTGKQAARPFMRPAFESEGEGAVEAFAADLASEVEKLGE